MGQIDLLMRHRTSPWFTAMFEQQRAVLRSPARRKAVLCGRRAGKTVLAAAALATALDEAGFDEAVVYAARTRAIAKRLIWAKLHRMTEQSGRAWRFSEAELVVTNERGGFLAIVGLDKPAEIEKLRGIKLRMFIGDEPATYTHVLESLYDEILEPACADLDGSVWLIGTPGPILAGFWHSASTGAKGFESWDRHHWTMFDNPHMPAPEQYLRGVLDRKGLDEQDPTVRQEYFGEWTQDDRAQVYRYQSEINDHQGMPAGYDASKWVHTVCVDFGIVDDFAWTVEASHPHESVSYVVEQGAGAGWLLDQMAETVRLLVSRYSVHFLGGDPGGGGKALIDAWNRRYADKSGGIRMQVVEKTEKRANIDIYNSDLRTGRLKYCMPACLELARELTLLPWADDTRLREHPSYPNNRADSALYAHRHHRAYLHTLPEPALALERLSPDHPTLIVAEGREYSRGRNGDWWDE